ncbi:MAG: D-alanine--D-alanine ligase [Lachnospiraceae bacterium]|nr:D-alanine--D-alanine ligase [Lachnospiraceae bacterium]
MKIVVLCGGVSTEREISIVSGSGVCRALREQGHQAILVDVFFGDEYANLMDAFPEEYSVDEAEAYIHSCDKLLKSALENQNRSFFGPNVKKLCKMADFVFLALHGENGENGKVQAAFDLSRIRYTGAGCISSALCMDKNLTKTILRSAGVPVPGGFSLRKAELLASGYRFEENGVYPAPDRETDLTDISRREMQLPVVVKVACGGSSVGVYIVYSEEEYRKALLDAFALEDEVLVEEYIAGREFSVGVIDGEALPVIEIAPLEGFYDYKNKYTAGAAIETCPADLPGEMTLRMKRYAELGYRALLLEGYGRLDFMMRPNGEMFCLECNTLPGMTPTSLIPQEARALGISYPRLCEKLIEVSMKKYEK